MKQLKTWTIRGLAVVCLTAVLLVTLVAVRRLAGYDPYWIDYDAPGIDITSEGPDNDDPFYNDIPWHENRK